MIKGITQTKKNVVEGILIFLISKEKFTPFVIEPAFGIGRIISAILEHNFRARDE